MDFDEKKLRYYLFFRYVVFLPCLRIMRMVVLMCMIMLVPFLNCLADEYRRQVSEDERLDSCYQQLEEEHEYREGQ